LLQKFNFLLANGIIDRDTNVRFESWSVRPIELRRQVDEKIPGSYANTMLHIVCDGIAPLGWFQETMQAAVCNR